MTPRINSPFFESDIARFSEELFSQLQKGIKDFDMGGNGPLFEFLHPAIMRSSLTFERSPSDLIFRNSSFDWNIQAFRDQKAAEDVKSGISTYGGFPWQVSQFIKDQPTEALIHFGNLGSVFLTKDIISQTPPKKIEIFHHLLPIWLDYTLSPELWAENGKWTRFHQRLHNLFKKFNLLTSQDFPGFYPLKKEALWLSDHGFQGRLDQNNFNLILTWDFPLSGLVELEKVLARGP